MGPSDQRRIFGDLAQQLDAGLELLDEQREYLSNCFKCLARGEDANEVFAVKFRRGQSEADADRRKMLSMLLHLVAVFVEEGMDVEPACVKVSELAQRLPEYRPEYAADYLRKCWYKYPHMKALERNLYDPDFPYSV